MLRRTLESVEFSSYPLLTRCNVGYDRHDRVSIINFVLVKIIPYDNRFSGGGLSGVAINRDDRTNPR